MAPSGWTDERVEKLMGTLLRVGVVTAAAVVLLGGAVYLAHHGSEPADHHTFRGEPADLRSLSGIVEDAVALRGRGIVQLGLLLLIGTPILRVAFSVFAFARQRDYLYVGLTVFVLGVLIYSLLG